MIELSLTKDRKWTADFALKRINHKGHEGTQKTEKNVVEKFSNSATPT